MMLESCLRTRAFITKQYNLMPVEKTSGAAIHCFHGIDMRKHKKTLNIKKRVK